jgi:hypothetical protein
MNEILCWHYSTAFKIWCVWKAGLRCCLLLLLLDADAADASSNGSIAGFKTDFETGSVSAGSVSLLLLQYPQRQVNYDDSSTSSSEDETERIEQRFLNRLLVMKLHAWQPLLVCYFTSNIDVIWWRRSCCNCVRLLRQGRNTWLSRIGCCNASTRLWWRFRRLFDPIVSIVHDLEPLSLMKYMTRGPDGWGAFGRWPDTTSAMSVRVRVCHVEGYSRVSSN